MLRHTQLTLTRIQQFGDRLLELIYPERRALQAEYAGPVGRIPFAESEQLSYQPAQPGLSLSPLWATFWFRLKGEVPADWAGKRVDLIWISHSEATLWRDGQPVQGLNFEPTIKYNRSTRPDAKLWDKAPQNVEVSLSVEVACNQVFGYDMRELSPYKTLSPYVFETADIALFDEEAWDLFHDYQVLADLALKATPAALTPWEGHLIARLNEIINHLKPENRKTWPAARKELKRLYENRNATYQHEITAIGHAHIDTAWLWPLAETKRKCVRSFSSTLAYMEDYPEYKFACSQAQQYVWIKEQHPGLYEKIKKAVKKGQWIPVGGTWIEPDCNIPSGESLVRQFLYGKRFFEQEFGVDCKEFWNPDVFGYSGALPQIMRGFRIEYFLTQKLSWSQFNKPMHHNFYWEGIDGSRVLTHFPPADTYNAMAVGFPLRDLLHNVSNYKDHDRANESMFLFGHGDGGGGPTKQMLEVLRRVEDLQGVPRTKQRSPAEFFARLKENLQDVPTMSGELYLEYHRGTYTTQAAVKQNNRRGEFLLREVELLSSLSLHDDAASYPQNALDELWKLLLLNQFHDIIPGSSIHEVYEDAAADYARILAEGKALRDESLRKLQTDENPALFNTCGWTREVVIEAEDKQSEALQLSYRGRPLTRAILPAIGAAPIGIQKAESPATVQQNKTGFVLENASLRAEFLSSGVLSSLFDKTNSREAIAPNAVGNQFVIFDDHPTAFDAWDVEAYHLESRETLPGAHSARILENGPLRVAVEFQIAWGQSALKQRVFLAAHSPYVEFECEVDWRQRHQILKVEFPVDVRSLEASYEIQFGYIKRPTHFNTSHDIGRFESCGHKWVDISQPDYGVSLLTDSKYGYSVHGSTMRISLLRGPTYPDPEADQGHHAFRFACYPHAGDLLQSRVVQHAYEFNCPALWTRGGTEQSWFSISNANLIIDTVKKAEDSTRIIVRMYEAYGTKGKATLNTSLPYTKARLVNLLEEECGSLEMENGAVAFEFSPFQLVSVELS